MSWTPSNRAGNTGEAAGSVKSLRLYLSTVRHLRARQLLHLARARLLPPAHVRQVMPGAVHRRAGVRLGRPLTVPATGAADNEFRFLNTARTFPAGRIDWKCADMPKLWRYNLHYFDYLHEQGRSANFLASVVDDWISNNPPGSIDAWEPYTVSLRIVNWIKWFVAAFGERDVPEGWLYSLYLQSAWLEKNIEQHLLANHYLKNAKALLFAGSFFSGADAERWLAAGTGILREEVVEQILGDGGHIERSPMYHSIVVEDCLDALNLLQSNPELADTGLSDLLRRRTLSAMDFLNDIQAPDGQIPLFNDSAFHIARDPEQLFGYADAVLGYQRPAPAHGLSICRKADSGYFVIRDGKDALIIDCGDVGPDYQPGHAHCDTLSFELSLDGRRVVVDSGVYDYEAGEVREYVRSTRAHNTVEVDGMEQSEVWGVFRVARRARPLQGSLEQTGPDRVRFEGAHDGYRRIGGRITHRRIVDYDKQAGWLIEDRLEGGGRHRIRSFIHLAPGLDLLARESGESMTVTDGAGAAIATIDLPPGLAVSAETGWYFPEFGIRQENTVICFSGEVELPYTCTCRIRKIHT